MQDSSLFELPEAPAAPVESRLSQPVARVLLQVPLPHLNQTLDYLVPEKWDEQAQPGARVIVTLAGRKVEGFLVERATESKHHRLAELVKVISPVAVLRPEILHLAQAVASRNAGALADVLRHAIPPRHARAENKALQLGPVPAWCDEPTGRGPEGSGEPATAPVAVDTALSSLPGGISEYAVGEAFLRRLASGKAPRAVLSSLPRPDLPAGWARPMLEAAAVVARQGKGAILCFPTTRLLTEAVNAWQELYPDLEQPQLWHETSSEQRYTMFMRLLQGNARLVFGLRGAVFAPVQELALMAQWDDGDDHYQDPSAPYWHTRTVLAQRAGQTGCAVLLSGYARSVEAQSLIHQGWAVSLEADRAEKRARTGRVRALDEVDVARDGAAGLSRFPPPAHATVAAGLKTGPVLVVAARAGYVDALLCDRCAQPARCRHCEGPLKLPTGVAQPHCSWCGKEQPFTCRACGQRRLRAGRIGVTRLGEELGKAFPGVPVLVSGTRSDGGVVEEVDSRPRLIVSTPGAEPRVEGGYHAVVILDPTMIAARPELWAPGEALRRWLNSAALAAPGAQILLTAGAPAVLTQALVRWDPVGFAAAQLEERIELSYPPAVRMALLSASPRDLRGALEQLRLPEDAELLGPFELEDGTSRAAVRAPLPQGAELSRALLDLAGLRSAKRQPLQIRLDPGELW
ncbi:MAG: hypothetical protein Q3999_01225 [Buchananella hordeovulneris]|nr:hypothetical protein [Buchananella hordeovulneris]